MVALPNAIGVFSRQGGVWERINGGGASDGFTGPWVRVAGVWRKATRVYAKASGVWQTCWVNIDGELDATNRDVTAIQVSGSPVNAEAGLFWRGDGSIDEVKRTGGGVPGGVTTANIDNWRVYDNGREYEIRFEHVANDNVTSEPTLNTWLNLTDPDTSHELRAQVSGASQVETGTYDIKFREKITAPAAGNDEMRSVLTADTVDA